MTRKQIENKIEENKQLISDLEAANEELWQQSVLLSDKEQWFTEEIETISYCKNRKKISEEKLIGRINWNEDFKDVGTGKVITVERSQIVRVNGKWDW